MVLCYELLLVQNACVKFTASFTMASQLLADPSDNQKNLKIKVFTRHLGVEYIYFNELGRTREEIIAEHAPELLASVAPQLHAAL